MQGGQFDQTHWRFESMRWPLRRGQCRKQCISSTHYQSLLNALTSKGAVRSLLALIAFPLPFGNDVNPPPLSARTCSFAYM